MKNAAAILIGGALLLGAAHSAHAIPAFARKTQTTCSTCHAGVYPELNAWGRRFKENGYQMPAPTEAFLRESTVLVPVPGERLNVLREAPLSLRAQGGVFVPTDPVATSQNRVEFRPISSLFLLAGASIYPDVSVFASTTLHPAGLHHAAVGFHNLGSSLWGPDHVNVRFGRFLLWDYLRPEHRTITQIGNPGATLAVGLNPTVLDGTHHGFDWYGRLFRQRVFWQFALTQGAQAADGVHDLDNGKDMFGQVQVSVFGRQTLGALAYWGHTQITDNTTGLKVRFSDEMRVAGATAELGHGPVTLFGWFLWRQHDNPNGNGQAVTVASARAEVDVTPAPRWLFVGRWDQIVSADQKTLEQRVATAHVTYLVLTNLKLSAEGNATLHDTTKSMISFKMDVAL